MGLVQAMDISVSGINAGRKHVEIIASNLANISTTRSIEGGPYRRKIPVFAETSLTFAEELSRSEQKVGTGGVQMVDVVSDPTPLQKVFNPSHPDADAYGFVSLPNVDMSKEMVDLVYASKLYEANITVFNATKKMAQETIQIY